jgi:hypothetical protein
MWTKSQSIATSAMKIIGRCGLVGIWSLIGKLRLLIAEKRTIFKAYNTWLKVRRRFEISPKIRKLAIKNGKHQLQI